MPATGANPPGAQDEANAAQNVHQMFNSIAPRYDLLNHVLSASVDRLWWWQTARRFRASGQSRCGDAGYLLRHRPHDMALLKGRPRGARPILAADFARGMLSRAAQRFAARRPELPGAVALEADALHLPLRSDSLDLIVTAFGFRNLANYEAGLREFHRVLKTGRPVGHSRFQRARRPDWQSLCRLFSPRAAGHRTPDLRQGRPLPVSAHFGGKFSAAGGDAGN